MDIFPCWKIVFVVVLTDVPFELCLLSNCEVQQDIYIYVPGKCFVA